jgi:hypothetical protein
MRGARCLNASVRSQNARHVPADALRKRVLRDGSMAAIDPVVDLYNAISLRYAIPVGGENLAAMWAHRGWLSPKEQSVLT